LADAALEAYDEMFSSDVADIGNASISRWQEP
jgi:hypothetical protein